MSRSERKWDHIRLAMEAGQQRFSGFDDMKFVHQSLPLINLDSVHLNTEIGELSLSSPIFINAMTGGGGERTLQINQDLAIVARETGVAMAVGSQMSAIKDNSERHTFEIVRKVNPKGIIFANLGSEASVADSLAAVEMIEANALQIHLNVIQELTMPEGDRDFEGALERISEIKQALNIPVIVKEVGFGMSAETARLLNSAGIHNIDVGGFGGTNFAAIENSRREVRLSFFEDWGVPTVASLLEVQSIGDEINVIASGGIQTSMDIVKSLTLGASAVGLSGFILKILLERGTDQLIQQLNQTHEEVAMIMTALGKKTIPELLKCPIILFGNTYHWLNQRGIDTQRLSRR